MGGSYYKNGRWKDPKKVLIGKFHNLKPVGKPSKIWEDIIRKKHVTDPRNTKMEETSRRQRRMDVSSYEVQDPEGAVAPYMQWNVQLRRFITVDRTLLYQKT